MKASMIHNVQENKDGGRKKENWSEEEADDLQKSERTIKNYDLAKYYQQLKWTFKLNAESSLNMNIN